MGSSISVDIDKYFPLVIDRAKKIHQSLLVADVNHIYLEELVQEGFVGLLRAKERYNKKKAKFATFATILIDGAIKDYLRKLDCLTQRERQKVKELDRTKEDLCKSLGREPIIKEVAEALRLSAMEITKREALRIVLLSIEQEGSIWKFPSSAPNPEEVLISRDMQKLGADVDDCLEKVLADQERNILILRVLDEVGLVELGKLMNLEKDAVSRREKKAKSKMKQCLENKGWEVTDILEILL